MPMKKQVAQMNGTQFELVQYTGGDTQLIVHLPETTPGDILTKPMQDWVSNVVAAATTPMPTEASASE